MVSKLDIGFSWCAICQFSSVLKCIIVLPISRLVAYFLLWKHGILLNSTTDLVVYVMVQRNFYFFFRNRFLFQWMIRVQMSSLGDPFESAMAIEAVFVIYLQRSWKGCVVNFVYWNSTSGKQGMLTVNCRSVHFKCNFSKNKINILFSLWSYEAYHLSYCHILQREYTWKQMFLNDLDLSKYFSLLLGSLA